MLKTEHFETYGWEAAVRGARNPMNSWDKSDSGKPCDHCKDHRNRSCQLCDDLGSEWKLGSNDLELLKRLCNAGTDHRKFMRQIFVSVDITAPLYWWKEMDQYKVGTTTDSCSTMHKIASKKIELEDFSYEHLASDGVGLLIKIIQYLNWNRDFFNQDKRKNDWWQMIQLLPSSYNQKRTWTANYEVLCNIYNARKNHKLDEWHTFCDAIMNLPYAKELIIGGNENAEIY